MMILICERYKSYQIKIEREWRGKAYGLYCFGFVSITKLLKSLITNAVSN